MFAKYLDHKDKEEMKKFQELIDAHTTIVEALKQRFQTWFTIKLEKYKMDSNKRWTLDTRSGQIKIKEEPKP